MLVRSVVEAEGGDVVGEAEDGAEAVAQVDRLNPDVVVMDWQMPVMSGLQATVAVAARHPGVRIIAFSSANDSMIRQAFLDSGACAYVAKDDFQGLVDALHRCFAA